MDLEESYTFFKSCINKALEESTKRRKVRSKKHLCMNQRALQLKKSKKMLWCIYCRTGDILNHAQFVRCRNDLRRLTRELRREHERQLATDIKRNPKAFWKYANTRLCTQTRIEDLRDEGGEMSTTNQAKAQTLSTFFSSVFTVEDAGALPTLPSNFKGPTLEDVDVSPPPHKVEAKLASLKPSSSPGPDLIHPRVLHESASVLAGPLSELFRKSIDEAKLPTEWKVGEMIPIYKKGDRQSPASYRPVRLTAIPSKILESIVRDHLL